MHFYLYLLLVKKAHYVEFISCFFFFSAWSKQVCFEMTVKFKSNSMSTIFVLIVSIKFEELSRKNICFETDDEY